MDSLEENIYELLAQRKLTARIASIHYGVLLLEGTSSQIGLLKYENHWLLTELSSRGIDSIHTIRTRVSRI
jgi:hypothetical protein